MQNSYADGFKIVTTYGYVTVDGVWIGRIGFIDHLHRPFGTTSNYDTIADFNTTNHSMLRLLCLLSLVVAWQQLSTMAIPLQCVH
jgi:hypothetical protein